MVRFSLPTQLRYDSRYKCALVPREDEDKSRRSEDVKDRELLKRRPGGSGTYIESATRKQLEPVHGFS